MTSLVPIYIAGSSIGLEQDIKPFLLQDQAFTVLENAYVWREQVKKREGLMLLGRLRRFYENASLGASGVSPWTFNIYSTLVPPITPEATAEIEPYNATIIGSDGPEITVGAVVFTDNGDGTLSSVTPGNSGVINYLTGDVTLTHTAGAVATTITFGYYPGLPVMGILGRETTAENEDETIFFDTVYAYKYNSGFEEYSTGTTWQGDDWQFFSCANYRGVLPGDRLFFVTNFNNGQGTVVTYDPIRYTSGGVWTDFAPLVSATDTLFQARIIIPYYGRLVALNVYEGPTAGMNPRAAATNISNRCRFSKIGDPTAADAWRSDQFGKGGFIDAPTNESIVSAAFYKNTLIVGFERSTWQLRYVGNYGLPFLWERISSDYGTESQFSPVIFDEGVASVGDRAIVSSTAVSVQRIDERIPDIVFSFHNEEEGIKRVYGIRDFQRELIFWTYNDSDVDSDVSKVFPNTVLVYNYRNGTYAQFRDNVTCFGTFQPIDGITWNSLDVFWDDMDRTWSDFASQSLFPFITCGNQQGWIHYYGYQTPDDASLSITGVDLTTTPISLTIVNHNLQNGELVYITDLHFVDSVTRLPLSTDLNDKIYRVEVTGVDTVTLSFWDTTSTPHIYINNFSFTPVTTAAYVGGGKAALFPKLNVKTKDFNPFASQGTQVKISYVDFLTDCTPSAQMSVNIFANASQIISGQISVGNTVVSQTEVETFLVYPYYPTDSTNDPISQYAWHRFFNTFTGQYISIQMTYDDDLMNVLTTHQQTWVLNAICLFVRPGGKTVF